MCLKSFTVLRKMVQQLIIRELPESILLLILISIDLLRFFWRQLVILFSQSLRDALLRLRVFLFVLILSGSILNLIYAFLVIIFSLFVSISLSFLLLLSLQYFLVFCGSLEILNCWLSFLGILWNLITFVFLLWVATMYKHKLIKSKLLQNPVHLPQVFTQILLTFWALLTISVASGLFVLSYTGLAK